MAILAIDQLTDGAWVPVYNKRQDWKGRTAANTRRFDLPANNKYFQHGRAYRIRLYVKTNGIQRRAFIQFQYFDDMTEAFSVFTLGGIASQGLSAGATSASVPAMPTSSLNGLQNAGAGLTASDTPQEITNPYSPGQR